VVIGCQAAMIVRLKISRGPSMRDTAASLSLAVLGLLAVTMHSRPGTAEGALATTPTQDVARDGFYYGVSIDYASSEQAIRRALEECRKRTSQQSSRPQPELCKIVLTFRGECIAIAMDPRDGSPGIGWAVEKTLGKAQANAMAKCQALSRGDSGGVCRLEKGPGLGCDRR
jgi:hypothetical protein